MANNPAQPPPAQHPQISLNTLQGSGVNRQTMEEEWEKAFDHFGPRLNRYLSRFTEDRAEINAVLAAVWMRAYAQIRTLRSAGALESWLVGIARNTYFGRNVSQERREDYHERFAREPRNERDLEADVLKQLAWERIESILPDRDLRFIRMVRQGHTLAEIARHFGYEDASGPAHRRDRIVRRLRRRFKRGAQQRGDAGKFDTSSKEA